jgi:hypothetical protein
MFRGTCARSSGANPGANVSLSDPWEGTRRGRGEDAIYFDHEGEPCSDARYHRRCKGRWRIAPSLVACLLDEGLSVGWHVSYSLAECRHYLGTPDGQNSGDGCVIAILPVQALQGSQLLKRGGSKRAYAAGPSELPLSDIVVPEAEATLLRDCYRG